MKIVQARAVMAFAFVAAVLLFALANSHGMETHSYAIQGNVKSKHLMKHVETKTCPEGFELVGKVCEITSLTPHHLQCQEGSELVGTECITYASVQKSCPTGYKIRDDHSECVLTEFHHPTKYCKEGELRHGKCELIISHPIHCPSGFRLSSPHHNCVKEVQKQTVCEQGYTLQHNSCVHTMKKPAAPTCQSEFNFDQISNLCISTTFPPPTCPHGFQMQHPKQCLKHINKVLSNVCPIGYAPQGNMCRTSEETAPELMCPEHFSLDGTTHQCIKEVHSSPKCPPGFHEYVEQHSGAGCEREVSSILSSKHPECPHGTTSLPMLNGELKCVERVQKIVQSPSIITNPPKLICHNGELRGKSCVTYQQIPQDLVCPHGSTNVVSEHGQDMCAIYAEATQPAPIEIKKEPGYICHEGQLQPGKSGHYCVIVTEAPVKYICPHGSEMDNNARCVISMPHIKPSPTAVSFSPLLKCTEGQLMQAGSPELCITTRVKDVTLHCPEHYVLAHSAKKCVKSTPPMNTCPRGSAISHEGCLLKQVSEPKIKKLHPTIIHPAVVHPIVKHSTIIHPTVVHQTSFKKPMLNHGKY